MYLKLSIKRIYIGLYSNIFRLKYYNNMSCPDTGSECRFIDNRQYYNHYSIIILQLLYTTYITTLYTIILSLFIIFIIVKQK